MKPELCLGTVQFGLPYGITNPSGQVVRDEAVKIFELAQSSGINLLDTAQAYGKSEDVIGRCWPKMRSKRVIDKLSAGTSPEDWESNFFTSLSKVRSQSFDGFLLHRASDLLAPNGKKLLEWLESLRDRGLVKRIGVSIYEHSELEDLPIDRLQLVQLPLSLYDQRLLNDGTIYKLAEKGIAVHARSIFFARTVVAES